MPEQDNIRKQADLFSSSEQSPLNEFHQSITKLVDFYTKASLTEQGSFAFENVHYRKAFEEGVRSQFNRISHTELRQQAIRDLVHLPATLVRNYESLYQENRDGPDLGLRQDKMTISTFRILDSLDLNAEDIDTVMSDIGRDDEEGNVYATTGHDVGDIHLLNLLQRIYSQTTGPAKEVLDEQLRDFFDGVLVDALAIEYSDQYGRYQIIPWFRALYRMGLIDIMQANMDRVDGTMNAVGEAIAKLPPEFIGVRGVTTGENTASSSLVRPKSDKYTLEQLKEYYHSRNADEAWKMILDTSSSIWSENEALSIEDKPEFEQLMALPYTGYITENGQQARWGYAFDMAKREWYLGLDRKVPGEYAYDGSPELKDHGKMDPLQEAIVTTYVKKDPYKGPEIFSNSQGNLELRQYENATMAHFYTITHDVRPESVDIEFFVVNPLQGFRLDTITDYDNLFREVESIIDQGNKDDETIYVSNNAQLFLMVPIAIAEQLLEKYGEKYGLEKVMKVVSGYNDRQYVEGDSSSLLLTLPMAALDKESYFHQQNEESDVLNGSAESLESEDTGDWSDESLEDEYSPLGERQAKIVEQYLIGDEQEGMEFFKNDEDTLELRKYQTQLEVGYMTADAPQRYQRLEYDQFLVLNPTAGNTLKTVDECNELFDDMYSMIEKLIADGRYELKIKGVQLFFIVPKEVAHALLSSDHYRVDLQMRKVIRTLNKEYGMEELYNATTNPDEVLLTMPIDGLVDDSFLDEEDEDL